ncbi:MAG: thioredoxin-dependent thiol peroxidase [Acidimicrobiia bacterium]|nr:thioredoxin-dependent thiol peroxidase [Acidimicrobiia bacterium]
MILEIGDTAPDFTLTDHSGTPVSLGDFIDDRVVVYFYPRAFTPGCTGESCDFRDRYQTFADAGYRIIGISPDEPATLARFRDEYRLPFSLLSDPDHTAAAAFGAWGTKKNYGKEYEGLIRSTFVIGPGGIVEQAWHNVRAKGHVGRVEREIV